MRFEDYRVAMSRVPNEPKLTDVTKLGETKLHVLAVATEAGIELSEAYSGLFEKGL